MSEVSLRPPVSDGSSTQGVSSGRRRGRRRGVDIRPGSVKQARREAGLSLGQVARSDISRTAIYFVETGKAKPSIETLRLIAERTGRPVEFFLQSDLAEARLMARESAVERLLAQGDNEGAIAAGETLLVLKPDRVAEAHIKLLMSMAYLRLAQPVMGRRLAADARSYFERSGDPLMTAECLGNEATAAYLLEDPSSIELAQGALAMCRSLTPVPRATESRLLGVLGHAQINNHLWEAAIGTYEQAIATAEVVQDLHKLSLMYSGLSLAYQQLGQFSQAGHFAQRALAIHEAFNDRLSIARSENNLGLVLLRSGDLAAAKAHFERSITMFEEAGVQAGKANILLSLSELAIARRDPVDAERHAREGLALAQGLGERVTIAEAHFWLAQVAEARRDEQAIDVEFAAALAGLDNDVDRERVSRYRVAFAEILEARGDLVAANQQLKLALASLRPAAALAAVSRAAIA